MSERLTSVEAFGVDGSALAQHGRRSRAEMVRYYREHHEYQLKQAQAALAVADEDLVVATYLGVWAQRNRQVITE